MTPTSFHSLLKQHNLDKNIQNFPESTHTAQQAADAIGCEVGQIGKSIIFRSQDTQQTVLVITSGKNLVDIKKIESVINQSVEKADAAFVKQHTGFSIGAVPPFGHIYPGIILIDEELTSYTTIWCAAGTANSVFEIPPQTLIEITQGRTADVKK